MRLFEMRVREGGTILVEVPEEKIYRNGGLKKTYQRLDTFFDEVIQKQIFDNCKTLVTAFEKVKKLSIPPQRCSAEFGLQFNGEGNVYIAKISSQASFKVSFEWNLNEIK